MNQIKSKKTNLTRNRKENYLQNLKNELKTFLSKILKNQPFHYTPRIKNYITESIIKEKNQNHQKILKNLLKALEKNSNHNNKLALKILEESNSEFKENYISKKYKEREVKISEKKSLKKIRLHQDNLNPISENINQQVDSREESKKSQEENLLSQHSSISNKSDVPFSNTFKEAKTEECQSKNFNKNTITINSLIGQYSFSDKSQIMEQFLAHPNKQPFVLKHKKQNQDNTPAFNFKEYEPMKLF